MNLPSLTTPKFVSRCTWALSIIVVALLPLKIWRASMLKQGQLIYYPGNEWSVAVHLTKDQKSSLWPKLQNGIDYDSISFQQKQYSPIQHEDGTFLWRQPADGSNPESFTPRDLGINAADKNSAVASPSNEPPFERIKAHSYWHLTQPQLICKGLFDRLDDVSWLNSAALLVASGLLGLATTSLRASGMAPESAFRTAKLSVPSALALGLLYAWLYLRNSIEGDRGPIHGNFWTHRNEWTTEWIPWVWLTQWIDAVLFCIVCAIFGMVYVAAWNLAVNSRLKNRSSLNGSRLRAVEVLANLGIAPLSVLYVIVLFFASEQLGKLLPGFQNFVRSIIIPIDYGKAIGAFVAHWTPFIVLSAWTLWAVLRYNHGRKNGTPEVHLRFKLLFKCIPWVSLMLRNEDADASQD